MKNLQKIKALLIAGITLSFLSLSIPAVSAEKVEKVEFEKCAGIAKPGQADGQTTVDGKKTDWILVPAGACMKLVGGKVIIAE